MTLVEIMQSIATMLFFYVHCFVVIPCGLELLCTDDWHNEETLYVLARYHGLEVKTIHAHGRCWYCA